MNHIQVITGIPGSGKKLLELILKLQDPNSSMAGKPGVVLSWKDKQSFYPGIDIYEL